MPRIIRSTRERGSAVLAALTIIVMLSVVAFVVDFGILLVNRTEIAIAVDAAALAAAQDLPNMNNAKISGEDYVNFNLSSARYTAGAGTTEVTVTPPDVVRVHATRSTGTFFAKVFGLNSFTVGATADATRYTPDLALIIDRSGSMCEDSHGLQEICPAETPGHQWEPFRTIQSTAKTFVDQMPPGTNFTLISYSTLATWNIGPTPNTADVKGEIDKLKPSGFTDIAVALELAIVELNKATGHRPKLVVLLTDGVPNVVGGVNVGGSAPATALLRAADKAREHGIVIYGINYGKKADNDLMRDVTEIAEGSFYSAPDKATLKAAYTEIANKVHIRLTYVN